MFAGLLSRGPTIERGLLFSIYGSLQGIRVAREDDQFRCERCQRRVQVEDCRIGIEAKFCIYASRPQFHSVRKREKPGGRRLKQSLLRKD